MPRRVYSREFKREAAQLVTMRGASVVPAARDLDVHANERPQGTTEATTPQGSR